MYVGGDARAMNEAIENDSDLLIVAQSIAEYASYAMYNLLRIQIESNDLETDG